MEDLRITSENLKVNNAVGTMILDKHKKYLNKIKQDFEKELGFLVNFQYGLQAKIASMYLSKYFKEDGNNYLGKFLNQV